MRLKWKKVSVKVFSDCLNAILIWYSLQNAAKEAVFVEGFDGNMGDLLEKPLFVEDKDNWIDQTNTTTKH